MTVLETEIHLTGKDEQNRPIVCGAPRPVTLSVNYLREGGGDFKDPKGHRWTFGIAAVVTDDVTQLFGLASQKISMLWGCYK